MYDECLFARILMLLHTLLIVLTLALLLCPNGCAMEACIASHFELWSARR